MTPPPACHRNERGIALLVALGVIAVVVALALSLHRKMDNALDAAVSVGIRTRLSHMTAGGIQLAMAMLIQDKQDSEIDSVQEDWANPEVVAEAVSLLHYEAGKVSVDISDERSRIQVNALVALPGHEFNPSQFRIWDRMLDLMVRTYEPLQDVDYMVMINSLKDWIDSGDDDAITGLSGAESSYYQDLDPPYPCRNAPIAHLDDLAAVKGFPPELFSGAGDLPQVSDILTPFGAVAREGTTYTYDGKVNINTAGAAVLTALLPEEYDTYGEEMVGFRLEKAGDVFLNDLTSATWYKSVPGLEDLSLDAALITTASDLFRITCTATLGEAALTTTAVVQREKIEKTGKWRCKVLSWSSI